MGGAAMKIGQVLSTVDFTAIPESERERSSDARRPARQGPAAAVQARSRSCSRRSSARPSPRRSPSSSARRSPPRRSARCIGRGPRTAAAWRSRSSTRASPRRSRPTCATCGAAAAGEAAAPGLDVARCCRAARARRRGARLRDGGEHHRAMARAWRDRPFVLVPPVDTGLSSRARARHRVARGGAATRRWSGPARPSATASPRWSSASSSGAAAPAPGGRRPAPGQLRLVDDDRTVSSTSG